MIKRSLALYCTLVLFLSFSSYIFIFCKFVKKHFKRFSEAYFSKWPVTNIIAYKATYILQLHTMQYVVVYLAELTIGVVTGTNTKTQTLHLTSVTADFKSIHRIHNYTLFWWQGLHTESEKWWVLPIKCLPAINSMLFYDCKQITLLRTVTEGKCDQEKNAIIYPELP